MEIALRVISALLVTLSISILGDILYPKFLKREKTNEDKAKAERKVYINNKLSAVFIALLIFCNIVGILIIALPNVVTEILKFNYVTTICVWWIPIIFDSIVVYIMFTKATYDDEKITIKKLFSKPKVYYFSDIISYTKTGNLKVVTKNGNFLLFNALSGTDSLRQVIEEKLSQS